MSQASNEEMEKYQKKGLEGQIPEHLDFLRGLGFLVDDLEIGKYVKCAGDGSLTPSGSYCYRTIRNELRSGDYGLVTTVRRHGEGFKHRTTPKQSIFFGISPLSATAIPAHETEKQEQTPEELRQIKKRWEMATAPVKSLYLERKGLAPCEGVRFSVTEKHGSSLVIPIRDRDRNLRGIEYINNDGNKCKVGRYRGYGFRIGSPVSGGIIAVCEGYATGLCLHRLLGMQVVCAFSACNMAAVAQVLRDTRPSVGILVCGDNDRHLPRNEGLLSAERAARQVGGMLAIPNFGDIPASKLATDWLDLVRERGEDEARDQLINGCKIAKGVA